VLSLKISIGAKTDIGCVREANEDSFYSELPGEAEASSERYALLLVADGMGGQVAGKEASEAAVDVVKARFADTSKAEMSVEAIKEFILASFHEANRAVFEKGKAKAVEMGTTLTAAFIDRNKAYLGHVGDSRAYHLRGREIRQVTEDHTLAEDMVKQSKATREEVSTSPMRSMLTRSIGTKEEVALDPPVGIELEEGDVLVLCTDGLTNLVEEREILSTVHNTPDVQKACAKLVDMARKRGGHDNITVVAAEFGALQRIKGLGTRAKTVSVQSAQPEKEKRRKGLLFAALGVLVALFIFLAYLFVSYYREQEGFYKKPGIEGETEVEDTSSQ
jgi:serine/threonine protein phosphatase PrpC